MKKNGGAESTIERAIRTLKQLLGMCNINEPEQVKEILAKLEWKTSTKHSVCSIYSNYLTFINKKWIRPKYPKDSEIPYIPTEAELDCLISAGQQKTANLLQLLKETGARIGEISRLKWINFDTERRTISTKAEKGSNNRILPLSPKCIAMLNNMPKTNEQILQTC